MRTAYSSHVENVSTIISLVKIIMLTSVSYQSQDGVVKQQLKGKHSNVSQDDSFRPYCVVISDSLRLPMCRKVTALLLHDS